MYFELISQHFLKQGKSRACSIKHTQMTTNKQKLNVLYSNKHLVSKEPCFLSFCQTRSNMPGYLPSLVSLCSVHNGKLLKCFSFFMQFVKTDKTKSSMDAKAQIVEFVMRQLCLEGEVTK